MQPLTIHFVTIFHIAGVLSTINCPLNETEWKPRSKTKVCQGSDVYHCLLVEDGKTRKERCTEKTLIMDGHCPVFTKDDYIHWKTCNRTGCPRRPFRSDEVYKYPICFGDIESRDKNVIGNQKLGEGIGVLFIIGTILGVLVVLVITVILVMKMRKQNLPTLFIFSRNEDTGNEDTEIGRLIRNPEYISNGIYQLKARNILYVIGELGNSVSTSGKEITKKYAEGNEMRHEYYNYLDVSKSFSEFPPEKVFKLGSVNFIDGWGGLWNENPCEKRVTLDTMAKVFEQSQTVENKKFIIGLRTEIRESLKNELSRRGIHIRENERLLLDSSSIYKRRQVEKEIQLLQNSCSNDNCCCKALNLEKVSRIEQVPIGIYLVVKLMNLDHTMIPDFLRREIGPLKAMRSHFEGLMKGDHIWSWLPYFVCMGYYDKKEFRDDIAVGFDISRNTLLDCENIIKYTKPLYKLSPMWSERFSTEKNHENGPQNVLVFWHNFLYITAFHACFRKYPIEIMRFCNLDAILQLVRPKGHPDPLIIEADDKEIDFFCEKRLENLVVNKLLLEHPLVQDWKNRNEKEKDKNRKEKQKHKDTN